MNFTKFRDYMDKMIKHYGVPGLDCIVYKEHEPVFRYTAGFSDVEEKKTMNGNELFLLFSMTKMLTCTAALQLYEQGKYIMSDPVARYMPEFGKMKISGGELDTENAAKITTGAALGEESKDDAEGFAKNQITIKDLFTMSGGLDYDLCDKSISDAKNEGKKTTLEIVSAMSGKVLGFEPGTRFRYSLCHDVLGALVEVWSGKKLGDYMDENIFKPLGMENSFFGIPTDKERLDRMAALYVKHGEKPAEKIPLSCPYNITDEYQSGGAGLTSSAEDYAIFLDALACGGIGKNGVRILSSATVELMGTNHLTGKQSEDFEQLRAGYGYGLGVRTHIDKTRSGSLSPLGEFGWDGAAGAFSMVDTKNKVSLTYFQHMHGWDVRTQSEMRNALYACLDD